MRIRRPRLEVSNGSTVLAASIESKDPRFDGASITFRHSDIPEDLISTRGDAFLAACLLPSMILGEDLILDETIVSPRLLKASADLIEIYSGWLPDAKRIAVVPGEVETAPGGDGVGLFFSAGVDSFHALLKDREMNPPEGTISHLIFVRGFEHFEKDEQLWALIREHLQAVARETGTSLIVIETNLRSLTDQVVAHPVYHLADSAAAALTASPALESVQMAASYAWKDVFPYGQHPVIDPLWSTEAVEFKHVGAEQTRIGKVRSQIARSDLALQHLLVCREMRSVLNCGRCGKCSRTCIDLAMMGALERCKTLPDEVDEAMIRSIGDTESVWVAKSLRYPHRGSLPRDLDRKLRRQVSKYESRRAIRACYLAVRERKFLVGRILGKLIRMTRSVRRG